MTDMICSTYHNKVIKLQYLKAADDGIREKNAENTFCRCVFWRERFLKWDTQISNIIFNDNKKEA